MAAKLRFRKGAWWAVLHYNGKRKLKRIGTDKREGQSALRDLHDQRRLEVLERGWGEVPSRVFCDRAGGSLDERNLHRTWDRLRRRAAKGGVRPLKLHCARHTFASLALASFKSVRWVAAQLGDANPELTLSRPPLNGPPAGSRGA